MNNDSLKEQIVEQNKIIEGLIMICKDMKDEIESSRGVLRGTLHLDASTNDSLIAMVILASARISLNGNKS